MIVTRADGSTEDIQLFDYGTGNGDGVPVVWADGIGVRQDPSYGSNVYQPGAVLTDDHGRWFQIASNWSIVPFGGSAPAAPASNPATQPQPPASAPPTTKGPVVVGTNTSADPNVRATQGTVKTLATFFGQNLRLGQGFSVPYWVLGAAGVAIATHRRRRR